MRLLRVGTALADARSLRKLEMAEFTGSRIPKYAILSHTWTDDEVLYDDIVEGTATDRLAYSKLQGAMDQARKDGYGYIWIDTCCIDKRSSAELQEAINSMFTWYQQADVCYVYLPDIINPPTSEKFREEFLDCKWFSRGWTLQELLASRRLKFFATRWYFIGRLHKQGPRSSLSPEPPTPASDWLPRLIYEATGLDSSVLVGEQSRIFQISIATRMSWASFRETTREEDKAYCLMGIFDINMPLLYGEGSKAFFRLQEEIMRRSDDDSLFCWRASQVDDRTASGLFAESPLAFRGVGDFETAGTEAHNNADASPFVLTNRGVQVRLRLNPLPNDVYFAKLTCRSIYGWRPAIYLKRWSTGGKYFARVFPHLICQAADDDDGEPETIFVREDLAENDRDDWTSIFGLNFEIQTSSETLQHYSVGSDDVSPWSSGSCPGLLRITMEIPKHEEIADACLQYLPAGEKLRIRFARLPWIMAGFGAALFDLPDFVPEQHLGSEVFVPLDLPKYRVRVDVLEEHWGRRQERFYTLALNVELMRELRATIPSKGLTTSVASGGRTISSPIAKS